MDRLDLMEMQIACTDVVNRYAQAVNEHDVDGFVGMFAPDGVWVRPSMTMEGREQIRAFISQMFVPEYPVRHVNGGVVIDPIGPGEARVRSITCVFDSDKMVDGKALIKAPAYLAEYHDRIRKIDGRWLIQRRETTVTFISAYAQPIPGIQPINDSAS